MHEDCELRGKVYRWKPKLRLWIDAAGLRVPKQLARELDRIRDERSAGGSASDLTWWDSMQLAIAARDANRLARAEEHATRAVTLAPFKVPPAAVLSSILRKRNEPERALAVTDRFAGLADRVILTTRAAALMDLGRCQEAKEALDRAYRAADAGRDTTDEISHAYLRYKREC